MNMTTELELFTILTLPRNGISLQTRRNHQSNRCQRRQIEKIKNTTAVSSFFLFSAPALLAVRGTPLTARLSIALKTLGKERDCSQSNNNVICIEAFGMTSLKFKQQNYWSSWDFTFVIYKSSWKQILLSIFAQNGSLILWWTSLLCDVGYKISPHILLKKNSCDLNLGESLWIFAFFLFPGSRLSRISWHWKPTIWKDYPN